MFYIAREYNDHGPQDYLMDWDTKHVASFSSRKVAMQFANRTQAETWAAYLGRELPCLMGGTPIRYVVLEGGR